MRIGTKSGNLPTHIARRIFECSVVDPESLRGARPEITTRFWSIADIRMNAFSVAFGGKADMPFCGSPLSRSLGLIVAPSATTGGNRDLIVTLAARHKLPAIYADRSEAAGGGLVS